MIKKFITLLFTFSIILCFGAYFILQHIPEDVQDTEVSEIVGDSELIYFDYDFTKKIGQLNNFRPIFTLDTIFPTSSSNLMTPSPYPVNEPGLIVLIHDGNVFIDSIDISYVDNGETINTTVKYYNYTTLGKILLFFNHDVRADFDKYVNVDNLQSYLFDVYSIEYDSDLTTKVLYAFDKLFTYLSVPFKWVYNFIYDIYVFLQILVIW